MLAIDKFRLGILRRTAEIDSFKGSWGKWFGILDNYIPDNADGQSVFNFGNHLSEMFLANAVGGRQQSVLAGAGTVALIQAWKRRGITAQKAAVEMIEARRAATLLWSRSTKPLIRVDIARHMKGLRQNNCIEVPELDINKDCKKLVVEIKKLNKEVRDVKRGKETMLECYKKAQMMNILRPVGKDSVLEILVK